MRRWIRYLPLLLLIPLVDAILLFVLGVVLQSELGLVPAIVLPTLLVVLTATVGGLLVRAEGRRTLRRFSEQLQQGQIPTNELLDGAFLIAAGAFLLTPGLVTDALGFLFALPPTRVPIREALRKYVITPYIDDKTDGFVTGRVYTSGFPGGDDGGPFGATDGGDPGSGPDPDDVDGVGGPFGDDFGGDDLGGDDFDVGDVHDLDQDAYDIDIEDETDGST